MDGMSEFLVQGMIPCAIAAASFGGSFRAYPPAQRNFRVHPDFGRGKAPGGPARHRTGEEFVSQDSNRDNTNAAGRKLSRPPEDTRVGNYCVDRWPGDG